MTLQKRNVTIEFYRLRKLHFNFLLDIVKMLYTPDFF